MNKLAASLTFLLITSQAAGAWVIGFQFIIREMIVLASIGVVMCVYEIFRSILTGVE
jgi:hypothetical protein